MQTMKQWFEDLGNIEADYEALMKAEADQHAAFESIHEGKMKLLGEQREKSIERLKVKYGVVDPVSELK